MLIHNLTIQDLVTNYFQVHQQDLPGASDVNLTDYNKIINLCALAWLTGNCGKVYQEITDDENLNADLIDIFAQTFVRHFWSTPIGYDSPVTFFVHLRGFLDEALPLWAQFYKEAIINQGVYYTNTGSVTVEDNGTVHFKGTNSSDNLSTTTGTSSTNANNNDSSVVVDSTTDQKTTSSSLNADADSPQDQLNLSINQGDGKGNASGGYDFKYASKVTGGINTSDVTTTNNARTTTNSNNSTTGNNSTKQHGHNLAQDSHDQQTGNFNKQLLNQRTQALSELAFSVSQLANGAYQNIFLKMKRAGLFLLTY